MLSKLTIASIVLFLTASCSKNYKNDSHVNDAKQGISVLKKSLQSALPDVKVEIVSGAWHGDGTSRDENYFFENIYSLSKFVFSASSQINQALKGSGVQELRLDADPLRSSSFSCQATNGKIWRSELTIERRDFIDRPLAETDKDLTALANGAAKAAQNCRTWVEKLMSVTPKKSQDIFFSVGYTDLIKGIVEVEDAAWDNLKNFLALAGQDKRVVEIRLENQLINRILVSGADAEPKKIVSTAELKTIMVSTKVSKEELAEFIFKFGLGL